MHSMERQYREELEQQEIKSNKRTVQGFICLFAAQVLVWIFTATGIFLIEERTVSITIMVTGIMLIPVLLLRFRTKLSDPRIKYVLLVLVCAVSSMLVASLTIHTVLLVILPFFFAVQYRDTRSLWFTFGINTAAHAVSCYMGFYSGICDLNLLFESSRSYQWYMSHIKEINGEKILAVPFNENIPFVIGLYQIFPRMMIMLLFTILLQYIIVSNYSDAVRIAELTYKKDTDFRTNVFNKTKYEEMANEYYPEISRVAVSFWDLNDLKYINDNFGHAMGDALIDAMSAALNERSSDRCRIYRIGGDEFLMIIDDPAENEIENEIKIVKDDFEKKHAGGGMKVSCAVGFAEGAGSDIRGTVKEADEKMYADKLRIKEQDK